MIDTTKLTARETQVLALVAQELTYAQIAERLHLERNTVVGYVRSVRLRWHIPSYVTLAQYVQEQA